MPLVLMAVAISMILGLAFLATASTASVTAASATHRLNARMIAESGIDIALAHIGAERSWRALRPNGTWIGRQSLAGGTLTVSVEDGDAVDAAGAAVGDGSLTDNGRDPIVITSVGEFGNSRHLVRVVRRPPEPSGIAVAERLSLKTNARVDSFDTSAGYQAATARSKAFATSNGLARRPSLVLRNNARVIGNAYFGPGGSLVRSVIMDPTAVVTGLITALPGEVELPNVVEPIWPGASAGALSYSSGTTTLTADLRCSQLMVTGTSRLRVVGVVNALVDGDCILSDTAVVELGRPIAYGVVTSGTVLIEKSSVLVDSYDSSAGVYGGTNAGSLASLATTATGASSVTVTGGAVVRGDVATGMGSVPATSIVVGVGSTITGSRSALATAINIPAPPAWPTNLGSSTGAFSIQDVTRPLSADLHCDSFKIVGNGVLRVTGHRVVRVNGELLIDGNGQLDVMANSSLTLYVGGQIRIGGNGVAANGISKDPSRLVIYSLGSGFAHELSNNAIYYGIFDSPNSPVRVSGNTQFYGAMIAQSLVVTDSTKFHHDRSPHLVDANPRLPVVGYTPGSKLNLYVRNKLLIEKFVKVNANTADPSALTIYGQGPYPVEVRDDAVGYGNVCVSDATYAMTGQSRWTGRIRARDALMAGNALLTTDCSGGTSEPGLLVEEVVELTDDAVVNGTGGIAAVATNSWNESTIRLHGISTFQGSLFTAPNGNPPVDIRIAPTATLTGSIGAQMSAAEIYASPSPPTLGSAPDLAYTGTAVSTISGDVYCRDFTIRDDAIVEVDGTTRLIMTGRFTMSGNAQLRLHPRSRLTVFCPDRPQVIDNARANSGGLPRMLVFHCGDNVLRFDLRTNAELSAIIHGPATELLVSDTAGFFGAFNGRRVKVSGNAQIHCAETRQAPISWLEQQ